MLQVKTYLDKSPIHGIGVFADEDIVSGQCTWKLNPNIDKIITTDKFTELEEAFIKKYAYFDKQLNKWILSADNDRFTNHSETPNTRPINNGELIAINDIKKGEEITVNYFEIDNFAVDKFFEITK